MGIGPPVVADRPDVDKPHLELLLRVSGWDERQHPRNQYNCRKPAADFPPHRGMHLRPRKRRARVLGYSSPRFPTSPCRFVIARRVSAVAAQGLLSVIARHEVPKQSPNPALDCFAAPCTRRCRTPLAMTSGVSIGTAPSGPRDDGALSTFAAEIREAQRFWSLPLPGSPPRGDGEHQNREGERHHLQRFWGDPGLQAKREVEQRAEEQCRTHCPQRIPTGED